MFNTEIAHTFQYKVYCPTTKTPNMNSTPGICKKLTATSTYHLTHFCTIHQLGQKITQLNIQVPH
jgi:hypothetical protein